MAAFSVWCRRGADRGSLTGSVRSTSVIALRGKGARTKIAASSLGSFFATGIHSQMSTVATTDQTMRCCAALEIAT